VRVHIAERHGWTDRHESAVEIVEELMEEPGIAYPLGRRWPS
jgi:nicotinamide riboside kinase